MWLTRVLRSSDPCPAESSAAARGWNTVKAATFVVPSTMLAGNPAGGIGEWGFSGLLEVDGRWILIDTGMRAETVLRNAEELRVDLSTVEDVVLTHNHRDHTGGLITLRRELAKKNPKALSRAHVARGIFWSRRRRTVATAMACCSFAPRTRSQAPCSSSTTSRMNCHPVCGCSVRYRGCILSGTSVARAGCSHRREPLKTRFRKIPRWS